jgi:hypothetical protein
MSDSRPAEVELAVPDGKRSGSATGVEWWRAVTLQSAWVPDCTAKSSERVVRADASVPVHVADAELSIARSDQADGLAQDDERVGGEWSRPAGGRLATVAEVSERRGSHQKRWTGENQGKAKTFQDFHRSPPSLSGNDFVLA